MSILLHFKNLAKLLLVGAVLFIICSFVSAHAVKCVSAKSKNVCEIDLSKTMFAQADRQIRPESPDYLFIGDACVKASVPPVTVTPKVMAVIVGDSAGYEIADESQKTIIEYETEQNDTLSSLAEKFNISTDTIAWANNLSKTVALKPGQKLIIPPVSGVIHFAATGDTLSSIAQKYQAKTEEIIAFNQLSGENDIFIGDVLIIPNGSMPKVLAPQKPKSTQINQTAQVAGSGISVPGGYFLCPVSGCKRTQGAHFRNAVDLGGYCGAPIYASASGIVEKAKYGWSGGAGNNVTVSHLGGTIVTHYYHLQSISVIAGQTVKKGDVIGLMGSTGKSTGCHLHFEVIGAENPFLK